jgi:hypothetical protein
MEVQHHPDLHHKKKKFREYVYEFIMIFLAVTMGFFAERIRENLAEKSKEREYMKEIIGNLKYDTVRCSVNAEVNVQMIHGTDSLRSEIKKAVTGQINSNALYYFAISCGGKYSKAAFNTSAISELKNSGMLRVINDKKLMNQLADYYERKRVFTDSYVPSPDKVQSTQAEFFSLWNLNGYINSFDTIVPPGNANVYNYQEILSYKPALQLLKTDPKDLERLYNEETRFEMNLKIYNYWLYSCKTAATQLIADIRQVYDLDPEE